MRFTFPRNEKLKSTKLIGQLFREGSSITKYPIRLIYLPIPSSDKPPVLAGFSVPKKCFKKAVDRNRVKRLMRECYRLGKPTIFNNIEGNFAFLFLYIGREMPDYGQVEDAMNAVVKKFLRKEKDAKSDQ